ncbi:MAG TPA: hypothetical protein VF713_05350 [Thermoanaerobaculia bacterium]
MTATSTFAIASRDELWLRGTLMESRVMHGQARQHGQVIDATDARDERLVRTCNAAIDAVAPAIAALRDARVRTVVRATRENDVESVETTMTIAIGDVSVVTTPADAPIDSALLRMLADAKPSMSFRSLPIVWQNGSAAVLLHEAIGHPNEHGSAPVSWPPWLSVDAPLVTRRETFRDAPLPRMKHLVARQTGAPFALPSRHIEVQLISGGAYDPVTDIVTINVAVSTAGPFTIRRTRAQIAAALAGAAGEPVRYPGVICSREGQELYVASHAPVMITDTLI